MLSLGATAILPFFFTPRDPVKWPFLGAVLGLHILDLVTWGAAWLVVSRLRHMRDASP